MKNFLPTLLCLVTLLFVAWRDGTASLPPYTWYDVVGILAVVGLVASFIWGLVQQANENEVENTANRKIALYSSNRRPLDRTTPPKQSGVPTKPPERK